MSRKKKNKQTLRVVESPPVLTVYEDVTAKKQKSKNIWDYVSNNNLLAGIAVIVVVGLIAAYFSYTHMKLQISIEEKVNDRIDAMETRINSRIDKLELLVTNKFYSSNNANALESNVQQVSFLASEDFISSTIINMNTTILLPDSDSLLFGFASFKFDNDYEIGTDSRSGEKIVFADLKGHSFLTSYFDKENELEIWVYGIINEKGNWDGRCILNGYNKAGELKYLLETEFDDGNRIAGEYKQIRYDEEANQYIISNRIYNDDTGIDGRIAGETLICKSFDFLDREKEEAPIRYADCSLKGIKVYYNGEIFGGSFNDSTGTAYSISYHDDGTIKTLYRGHFRDGEFNDTRGRLSTEDQDLNAFWISWAAAEEVYIYWYGTFINGRPEGLSVPSRTYMNQKENLENIEMINQKLIRYPEFRDLEWRELE